MKKFKKYVALGLSAVMVCSMAIAVGASSSEEIGRYINTATSGETGISAQGDIDVDGYLQIGSESLESYNSQTSWHTQTQTSASGGTPTITVIETTISQNVPVGPSGSTVSWGDTSTKDTTQLIITAPTYLSFQITGQGTTATFAGAANDGKAGRTKGTIYNQSCYIQGDSSGTTIPKTVGISAQYTAGAAKEFELLDDGGTLTSACKGGAVVHLAFDAGNAGRGVSYENLKNYNSKKFLGTLPKGTLALTSSGKYAVNASKSSIFFQGQDGLNTTIAAFAENYDGRNLHNDYNLTLTYTLN